MFFVNRLKRLKISFCLALALTLAGSAAVAVSSNNLAAFAEETATVTDYPAEFIKYASEGFENISDYAVSGGFFAFSEGSVISVIENGKERVDHKTDSTVTALDCDGNGKFFYKNGSGATFALEGQKPDAHDFQELKAGSEELKAGEYRYFINDKNVFTVFSINDPTGAQTPEGFTKVKKYDDAVYALKEGKFFKFDGLEAEEASGEISYTDLSSVKSVCFGETVQSLKTLNRNSLHFVALNAGEQAYVTEIDLNLLSDNPEDTFLPAEKTVKIGAADGPATGKEAMLLAVSGNTYVVAADGRCYIMNKANAGAPFERAFASVPADFTARVALDKACAYSSPFTCNGTKLVDLPLNASVKVLGKVEAQNLYVIEYEAENGEKVKGFTPYGYLSEHGAPIENDPPATKDPNYNEDSPAKTVVLIIAVIALVMIALGYLTFVATSSKYKDKKKKEGKEASSPSPEKIDL